MNYKHTFSTMIKISVMLELFAPYFLPIHHPSSDVYLFKWWVDGSLHKAMSRRHYDIISAYVMEANASSIQGFCRLVPSVLAPWHILFNILLLKTTLPLIMSPVFYGLTPWQADNCFLTFLFSTCSLFILKF